VRAILLVLLVASTAEAQIPRAAHQYRRLITANARLVFGLNSPTAVIFSQIHQESAFRADAQSPYASGLGQFTPATAQDMGRWYADLADVDVFNPGWSVRALVRYDQRLLARVSTTVTNECHAWAMTLAQYNGGPGWVDRDRRLAAMRGADPNRWWGHVERHSNRAAWAFKENRSYPRRILLVLQPRYVQALWGRSVDCAGIV
jgi:soluble lytic murein transglycosylase-like protein